MPLQSSSLLIADPDALPSILASFPITRPAPSEAASHQRDRQRIVGVEPGISVAAFVASGEGFAKRGLIPGVVKSAHHARVIDDARRAFQAIALVELQRIGDLGRESERARENGAIL